MALSINLTRRIRRRELNSGEVVEQTRYVLNWGDPRDGGREQRFFERQKDAQEKRAEPRGARPRNLFDRAQDLDGRRRRCGVARDEARHRQGDSLFDLQVSVPPCRWAASA